MRSELHKTGLISPPDAQGASLGAAADIRIEALELSSLDVLRQLNVAIFDEQRIINTFDREDLLMLVAYVVDEPAGFKVGYRENRFTFYSAKGGVLPEFRKRGVARQLLYYMMDEARARGYVRLAYDTFPNRHPGMATLGFAEGFRITKADYNPVYKDFRLRFEIKL